MIERVGHKRLLLGCALWSLSMLAAAQSEPPEKEPAQRSRGFILGPGPGVVSSPAPSKTEESGKATDTPTNSFGVLGSEETNQYYQRVQQQQAKLRAQLADPEQRAQALAQRIEQQRASNRDLVTVLRLDSRTEDKLIALLADQQLSRELQPPFYITSASSDGKLYNPMLDDATRYTQRMQEIARIIGAARLDDYVDYERKLGFRTLVMAFDAVLPDEGKLTFEQRNALTDLFYDQSYRSNQGFRGFGRLLALNLNASVAERDRRMQIQNIASNERNVSTMEAANRELLERAAAILTPEQTKALAASKQRELDQQRAWTQAQRKALGIAPDETLEDLEDDVAPPSPPISKNLRLTINLMVNETQVVKQLTSIRGGSVSFNAPEGLLVEVRPYVQGQQLYTDIKFYENMRGGRRMIGQMGGSAQLIEPGKPATNGGSGASMVQGRKGYAVNWSVSGSYL
jgi:hypothetical protein